MSSLQPLDILLIRWRVYNSIANTSKWVLFLPPSDIYVRSFLYLFYTLIKVYYTHTHKHTHTQRRYGPYIQWNIQFSSVVQSCPTLCDPMNCSTPGLPVHHQLPEFTQTHVHQGSDAIQSSHPLSSPSPPAPNPSQHQSLFQ